MSSPGNYDWLTMIYVCMASNLCKWSNLMCVLTHVGVNTLCINWILDTKWILAACQEIRNFFLATMFLFVELFLRKITQPTPMKLMTRNITGAINCKTWGVNTWECSINIMCVKKACLEPVVIDLYSTKVPSQCRYIPSFFIVYTYNNWQIIYVLSFYLQNNFGSPLDAILWHTYTQ